MWLHAHPLNEARCGAARRRSRPSGCGVGARRWARTWPPHRSPLRAWIQPDAVFGADPVVAGLCALSGARLREPAAGAEDLLGSGAARTAAVIELFRSDAAQPLTLLELLQQLDENLLVPLIRALKDGVIRPADADRQRPPQCAGARDDLRFWRRARPLAVLQ